MLLDLLLIIAQSTVPSEYVDGSKASTDELVPDLLERFSKSGLLLTLDYS